MSTVHVVVPAGVDDPRRPSGGNTYDRRACEGLRTLGWDALECPVPGDWPAPDRRASEGLAQALSGMPDDAVVLLDGLVASAVPEVLVPESGRLRQVALVHLPLGVDVPSAATASRRRVLAREAHTLRAARAVVVPSRWARDWLTSTYALPAERLRVVPPGVERADPALASAGGGRLLCVGAVTPVKGQDLLVEALASLADLDWSCALVGSVAADPGFSGSVQMRARAGGIGARVRFTGPLVGPALRARFEGTDLLVVASRTETYGMVVTEALARGIPVIAPAVGGLPESLGRSSDGRRPGTLVPPGDVGALAGALREWLTDEATRARLRRAAGQRRTHLAGWSATAASLAQVLEEVAA
ncbi:MAG TPA: glycosyltransferase family 4 protein [Phycicoccus sp.]|nr:glycosyltransferase family 4 protein [Phycicoccus sp.]